MSTKPAWVDAIRLYQNAPSGRRIDLAPAPQPVPTAAPVAAPASPPVRAGLAALWVLNILSLIAAILLAAAMLLVWQSVGELRTLDNRLAGLDGFERRMVEKVDRTNEGLQSQFDRTNRRIEALRNEMVDLRGSVDASAAALRAPTSRFDAAFAQAVATLPFSAPPPSSSGEPARETQISEAVPVPEARAEPASTSPRFERFESPNGSVTYRRVR